MNALIPMLVTAMTSFFRDRLMTKSTIDGSIVTAIAGTLAAEPSLAGITPDTIEYYVITIVMGLIGLYRIYKKEESK